MKEDIKKYYFTISMLWSQTCRAIKSRRRGFAVLYAAAVCLSLLSAFISYRIESALALRLSFYTIDLDYILSTVLFFVIVGVASLLLYLFFFGGIYTQVRAYLSGCRGFSLLDGLRYTLKCTVPAITSGLVFYGILIVADYLYVIFVSMLLLTIAMQGSMMTVAIVYLALLPMLALNVYFLIRYYFIRYAAFQYRYGGVRAIRYSDLVTKKRKGQIFGYCLLFYAGQFLVEGLFLLVTGGAANWIYYVLSSVFISAITLFTNAFFTVVFVNFDGVKKNSVQEFIHPLMANGEDCFEEYCAGRGILFSEAQEVKKEALFPALTPQEAAPDDVLFRQLMDSLEEEMENRRGRNENW